MARASRTRRSTATNRLVSLNDVGGDPAHFGVSVARFHAENLQRSRAHP